MNELIELRRNEAVTTSLQIAEHFGKRHAHVIEKIESIMSDSAEKSAQCFKESAYTDSTGKSNKMYYLNRDGFAFW